MTDKERLLQAPDVLSITRVQTGVSLTTSNILGTCETTYRTGLRDNNCGIRNFQRLVSTGHANSILSKTVLKTSNFLPQMWSATTWKKHVGGRLRSLSFLFFFSGRERPLLAGKPGSKFSIVLEKELGQKICIQYWHLI